MPYIKLKDRRRFNKKIDGLVAELTTNQELVVGEVNYVISLLIWKLFQKKPSYTLGNNLVGVLECVKTEFYRRLIGPLEDEKIKQNGDII